MFLNIPNQIIYVTQYWTVANPCGYVRKTILEYANNTHPRPFGDDLIAANDVSLLTEKLHDFLERPQQMVSRSAKIQQYVKSKFGLQKMLDDVKAYYQQLLIAEPKTGK